MEKNKIAMVEVMTKFKRNEVLAEQGLGKKIMILNAFDVNTQKQIYKCDLNKLHQKFDLSPLDGYNKLACLMKMKSFTGELQKAWVVFDYDNETKHILNINIQMNTETSKMLNERFPNFKSDV